jgi:hypothetical protein
MLNYEGRHLKAFVDARTDEEGIPISCGSIFPVTPQRNKSISKQDCIRNSALMELTLGKKGRENNPDSAVNTRLPRQVVILGAKVLGTKRTAFRFLRSLVRIQRRHPRNFASK